MPKCLPFHSDLEYSNIISMRLSCLIKCYSMQLLLCCILLSVTCAPPSISATAVSGKTIYGDMALEGVQVKILVRDNGKWEKRTEIVSGYHGSFYVKLPEGNYRFEGKAVIQQGTRNLNLSGVTIINVPGGRSRLDRVVISVTPDGE